MDPKPNASYGALISIVLILAIIVVGAIYVWGQRVNEAPVIIPIVSTTTEDLGTTTVDLSATSTIP